MLPSAFALGECVHSGVARSGLVVHQPERLFHELDLVLVHSLTAAAEVFEGLLDGFATLLPRATGVGFEVVEQAGNVIVLALASQRDQFR